MMTLARRPPSMQLPRLYEWFWDEEETSDGENKKIMLVMEYFDSCQTLEEFLKRNEDLDVWDARTVIRQIVKAGQECLQRNICHYDMHDSNILVVEPFLSIRLVDFGRGKLMIPGKHPRTDTKISSSEAVNVTVSQLFILIKEIAGHCSSIPAEFLAFVDNFYTLDEKEEDGILLPVEEILNHPWLKIKYQ
ncbi:serine/threonine-protein kinase pim-2 isoform X2 [Danio rerio]